MESIDIEILTGQVAGTLVNPFYKKFGSRGRARPDDVFFLAERLKEYASLNQQCICMKRQR